ncbi:MAG: hypothetical protein V3V97_17240 [Hyphomicrobiaceae bacterium]
MKLTKFKVTNFRSVTDNGWVETDDVTALIGVNESGKTNLLLPLWKLNPARDGEIQPTSDYPKTTFGEIRARPGAYDFISAEFETGNFAQDLARVAGITVEEAGRVLVTRDYDGRYVVEFPKHNQMTTVETEAIRNQLSGMARQMVDTEPLKKETNLKTAILEGIQQLADNLPDEDAMLPH